LYQNRRTGQGKSIIFRANAKFFGEKPAAKMRKKRENRNSRRPARFFAGFFGVGGGAVLQVTIALFRALSKYFSGKDISAGPTRTNGPYAYVFETV